MGFSFRLSRDNIYTPDVLAFLSALRRQLRRLLLLVLDRWSVHGAAIRRLRRCRPLWLAGLSWLPAYAPELYPVKQVWNHTKYSELANYLPDTLEQLHEAVGFSLASKYYHSTLLRLSFYYAKPKL